MPHTEIAFIRVEPGGKPMHVSGCVCTATTSSNSGETDECCGLLAFGRQERSGSDVTEISIARESTVRAYSKLAGLIECTNRGPIINLGM